jgi:hypothetical protein
MFLKFKGYFQLFTLSFMLNTSKGMPFHPGLGLTHLIRNGCYYLRGIVVEILFLAVFLRLKNVTDNPDPFPGNTLKLMVTKTF